MHACFTCLTSGANATGLSGVISIEKLAQFGLESSVVSLCMLNAGDSVQRYCTEHKFKLFKVECIILTSLSPHNVSGLAGILLSLSSMGVGKVTIIGPQGTEGFVNALTPFVNRRYPECTVVEAGQSPSVLDEHHTFQHYKVHVCGVRGSKELSSPVIGVSAIVQVAGGSTDILPFAVLPVASHFPSFPSLRDCVQWADNLCGQQIHPTRPCSRSANHPSNYPSWCGLFVPLECTICSKSAGAAYAAVCDLQKQRSMDGKSGFLGVWMQIGCLNDELVEFPHTQKNIIKLSSVFPMHFPKALRGLSRGLGTSNPNTLPLSQGQGGDAEGSTCAALRAMEDIDIYSGDMIQAVPRLTIPLKVCGGGGSTSLLVSAVPRAWNHIPCTIRQGIRPSVTRPNTVPFNADSVNTLIFERCRLISLAMGEMYGLSTDPTEGKNANSVTSVGTIMSSAGPHVSTVREAVVPVAINPGHKGNNEKLGSKTGKLGSKTGSNSARRKADVITTKRLVDKINNFLGNSDSNSGDDTDDDISEHSSNDDSGVSCSLTIPMSEAKHTVLKSDSVSDSMGAATSREGIGGELSDVNPVLLRADLLKNKVHQLLYASRTGDYPGATANVATPFLKHIRFSDSNDSNDSNSDGNDIENSSTGSLVSSESSMDKGGDVSTECTVPIGQTELPMACIPTPLPPHPGHPTVVFLGTGSAQPSKHRNGSCILITLPPALHSTAHHILLDVGEGSCAQLYQHCGGDAERYYQLLRDIRLVWISHHHADHVCGLPLLLEQIHYAKHVNGMLPSRQPDKVVVVASMDVIRYVEYSVCVSGLQVTASFTPITMTAKGNPLTGCLCKDSTGGSLSCLVSIPVLHCRQAYGVVLHLQCPGGPIFKIVYSGDTRPSKALICAGMSCDLLIHEATFDSTMRSHAVSKKHSTTDEALLVASQMKARNTLLTHFSQRYPSLPPTTTFTTMHDTGGIMNDIAEIDISEDGDDERIDICNRGNVSCALDFLHFAFPSQVHLLPRSLAHLMSVLNAHTPHPGSV